MTIKEITPAICQKIRKQIDEDLAALGDDQGLTIRAGNASYTENSVTFRLTVSLAGFNENEHTFKRVCRLYSLSPEDYGREFKSKGNSYRLVGINTRSPKYCFLGESLSSGKRYKFTDSILRQFDIEAEILAGSRQDHARRSSGNGRG